MFTISRQLKVPYSTAQMYALVNDVARYPEFVPYCAKALIHSASVEQMQACLTVEWQRIAHSFTTNNKLIENQSIKIELAQGLLKKLTGQWQFMPAEEGCLVTLSVELEFKNRLMGFLGQSLIPQLLDKITDAFMRRAKTLYHDEITVTLAYAQSAENQYLRTIGVPMGSTIETVIGTTGICDAYPEIDLAHNKVGILSQVLPLSTPVKAGDRVEIYRALTYDPMNARRLRAKGPASCRSAPGADPQNTKSNDAVLPTRPFVAADTHNPNGQD